MRDMKEKLINSLWNSLRNNLGGSLRDRFSGTLRDKLWDSLDVNLRLSISDSIKQSEQSVKETNDE